MHVYKAILHFLIDSLPEELSQVTSVMVLRGQECHALDVFAFFKCEHGNIVVEMCHMC